MIFTLHTLGLRYCHVAAMRWGKLGLDGVIAIEESYDVSANVFAPVDQRKKAPPMVALEPRMLELVRRHRRYLMQRSHPGSRPGWCSPPRWGRDRSATTNSAPGVPVRPVERDRILGERDPARLGRWIARAIECASVAELLSEP
jgi:hypothetical protein